MGVHAPLTTSMVYKTVPAPLFRGLLESSIRFVDRRNDRVQAEQLIVMSQVSVRIIV